MAEPALSYDTPADRLPRLQLLRNLHIDVPLLLAVLVLCGVGVLVLYSASGQSMPRVWNQITRLSIGLVAMLFTAQISPALLRRLSPWAYGAGIALLVTVLFLGEIGKGAQRWLDLGVVRFQPSELMKLALPMMLAWYFAERPLPPARTAVAVCAAIIIVPVVLILQQPDLGTAILIATAGFCTLFLAGLSWRILFGGGLALAAAAPVFWYFMHDYQRRRVLTFLNPESDPLGAGYHIIQSKIAIGSGGLYGKGWLNGTQSQLEFLPERSTDFIFAVFGEEFGLIGILMLIGLYLAIVLRGLFIATQAQDTFSRLLAGGLSLTFFFYMFINMGMVTGLLPVVGLPLPLISYGGTSMVTLMAGFGMIMSIHTHRRLLPT